MNLRHLLPLLFVLMGLNACGEPASSSSPLLETAVSPQLPTLTPVPTAVSNSIFIDANQDLGTISHYVYGASYGPWVTVTVEMQPLAEESGITYLRFPGGEWGDQNNLTDLQIDRFMAYADNLGAEPKINVRMPGGSPEQAADLVRYTNIENEYNIKYWSIGNEPDLYTPYNMYEDFDTARFTTVHFLFSAVKFA